jgi:hypothetical protein
MALKDLVAERVALNEAAIERIVEPYVRYDIDAKEIHFTPAFSGLSNKLKILVYLAALQGWRFVTDETIPTDARPGDVEAATGIPGGSLRPTLRALSETHHVSERDSRYSVRGTSFPFIEAELNGGEERVAFRRQRSTGRKSAKSTNTEPTDAEGGDDINDAMHDASAVNSEAEVNSGGKKPRKVGSKTGNVAATFERWIDDGYFDEPRTLSDVQKRFRKEAVMVPQTSLPGYFLSAVRKNRLTRDEVESNGRTVWSYTRPASEKTRAE